MDDAAASMRLADALDGYIQALRRFVVFQGVHQSLIVALYAAATFRPAHWSQVPYLNITSPEADSGKSTLLKVLRHLVHEPVTVASASPAWIYRKLDEAYERGSGVTLLIDEFDNLMDSDQELHAALSGILNVGYDKEVAKVGRTRGSNHQPVEYDCFGFKVLCGIGKPPRVVRTRMLTVQLQRALGGEITEPYDPAEGHIDYLADLHLAMAEALQDVDITRTAPRDMPASVQNRLLQLWRPLVAVADAAGRDYPYVAREAAAWSVGERSDTSPPILRDIAAAFEDDRLQREIATAGRGQIVPTESLVSALVRAEDSRWANVGTRPALTARRLGHLLSGYGLQLGERTGRGDDKTPRGISVTSLQRTLERYLPPALIASPETPEAVPSGPRDRMGPLQDAVGPDGTASNALIVAVRKPSLDDSFESSLDLPDPVRHEGSA